MGFEVEIKNSSDGQIAGVTKAGQLLVESESHELQHDTAFKRENTYQVIGEGNISSGSNTLIHLKNNDSARKIVISFIRTQLVTTAATLPATTDYLEIGYGETVSSGGTVLTPINTTSDSGKTADITATQLPTVTGTNRVLDKHYYTGAGDEQTYNKQGSMVLGLGETMTLDVEASAAGYAYVRVTFMMIDNP